MNNNDKENSSPVNNDLVLSGPAKSKATAKVFFPCVHGEASGQLIAVNCFQAKELKGTIKAVSGIDDESARRIIGAARYSETDDRAATGVISLFSNPLFGGKSYGLALALSDKIVRHGSRGAWTEIYATGKIPPDGCGAVEAIRELERKIELIISNGKPDSLFVFPSDNLSEDPVLRKKLALLEESRICWVAIHNLKELDGILWQSKSKKDDFKGPDRVGINENNNYSEPFYILQNPLRYITSGILCFLGLLAIIFIVKYFFWQEQDMEQHIKQDLPQKTIQDNFGKKNSNVTDTESASATDTKQYKSRDSWEEDFSGTRQSSDDNDVSPKLFEGNSENKNIPEGNFIPRPMPDDIQSGIKMGSEHMKMDDF